MRAGRVLFVNTLFNCLATVSEHDNFTPLWQPPFISQLARGNRCHLNGLALRDGQPAYMTSASRSDTVDGWRDDRRSGGAVTDIVANEVVVTGLSMPDSPRWYRDTLWLTNSGNGEFGRVDLARGHFEPIVTAPGIVRGLCFVGDWAIVGVSKPRSDDIYVELALGDRLRERNVEPRCGLLVIDLRSGAIVHSLFFEGKATREVFDVVALPGVRRPMAVGFANDAIQEVAIAGPPGQL